MMVDAEGGIYEAALTYDDPFPAVSSKKINNKQCELSWVRLQLDCCICIVYSSVLQAFI